MSIAQILAMRGTCRRAKVGAVIVKDNRIISTGYVGSPAGMPHCTDVGCEFGPDGGCIRTAHAEANAVAFAAKNGISVDGATLYCTLSSCYTCAKLIINAGIKHVVYLHDYRDTKGVNLLQAAGVEVRYLHVEEMPLAFELEALMEGYTKPDLH